jgi:hypothetical protein
MERTLRPLEQMGLEIRPWLEQKYGLVKGSLGALGSEEDTEALHALYKRIKKGEVPAYDILDYLKDIAGPGGKLAGSAQAMSTTAIGGWSTLLDKFENIARSDRGLPFDQLGQLPGRDVTGGRIMQLPIQTRQGEMSGVNPITREVSFSFSSTSPVQQKWGIETLSHDPGSLDTTRLDAGAVVFLREHDFSMQCGKVVSYQLGNRKNFATARLFRSAAGHALLRRYERPARHFVLIRHRRTATN